jgi:hypothetical protein
MERKINLLPFEYVKEKNIGKMIKDSQLYYLRKIDKDIFYLSPFRVLLCKGSLTEYLNEKGIELYYIIDGGEFTVRERFADLIQVYDVIEDGYLAATERKSSAKVINKKY